MIFKKIRDWWKDTSFAETPSPPITPTTTEPQEVWQWQINCISPKYALRHKPMPQNFGLLIGTKADAEARLKASVSLPNYYKTQARDWYSTTYEFSDAEQQEIGRSPISPIQRGAIRCVSENLKLIRTGTPSHTHTPFIVETTGYDHDFEFHPIKPQDRFIKGERESK